jgi:hypothetical protein
MQHFSSEQWADFVRNVSGDKDRAAMEAHLESGCKRCSTALAHWLRIRDAAVRERSYEPPVRAVCAAKGLVALRTRPRRVPIAQLLFDSFRAPAFAAGTRSFANDARQLLYAADDFRVDLRIEPNQEKSRVCLLGQVLISSAPARPATGVRTTLLQGSKILATLQTNEFGEFEVGCDLAPGILLRFALPQEIEVQVPLPVQGRAVSSDNDRVIDLARHTTDRRESKGTRKRANPRGS